MALQKKKSAKRKLSVDDKLHAKQPVLLETSRKGLLSIILTCGLSPKKCSLSHWNNNAIFFIFVAFFFVLLSFPFHLWVSKKVDTSDLFVNGRVVQ